MICLLVNTLLWFRFLAAFVSFPCVKMRRLSLVRRSKLDSLTRTVASVTNGLFSVEPNHVSRLVPFRTQRVLDHVSFPCWPRCDYLRRTPAMLGNLQSTERTPNNCVNRSARSTVFDLCHVFSSHSVTHVVHTTLPVALFIASLMYA